MIKILKNISVCQTVASEQCHNVQQIQKEFRKTDIDHYEQKIKTLEKTKKF